MKGRGADGALNDVELMGNVTRDNKRSPEGTSR